MYFNVITPKCKRHIEMCVAADSEALAAWHHNKKALKLSQMIDQEHLQRFRELLTDKKQILIIFPENPSHDLFLASYSLFTFLNNLTPTRILSPSFKVKLPTSIKSFVEISQIETELGKQNLLISFPYQEEQVDKVSYYIGESDQRFYLTIKPRVGVAPLDSAQVEFSYAGTDADLIILLGVDDLEQLKQLYFGYENLYKNENNHVVTIQEFIPEFGSLNIDTSTESSYAEAIWQLLHGLEDMQSDVDFLRTSVLPTLLLYGIESNTQALQSVLLQPATFMAVADLLQRGASRLYVVDTVQTESPKKSSKPKEKPIQLHSVK